MTKLIHRLDFAVLIDLTCDYLVIGSGAAALSSALRAALGGLDVVVIEKAGLIGGTSAMSGAGIWIPANHIARRAGIADSADEALTYIRAAMPPEWVEKEEQLWRAFTQAAPDCLEFIERNTPLQFVLVPQPDPFAERPGGKVNGRMLTVRALSRRKLGSMASKLRSSTLPQILEYGEMVGEDPYHRPIRAVLKLFPRLAWRWLTGARGQGAALVTGLAKGCLDAGVRIHLRTEAVSLEHDDVRVTGVRVKADGVEGKIRAGRGVLLATGGFEWDDKLRNEHFPGPLDFIGSPASNSGDGQRMAAEVGAALDRMDQANIYPCLPTIYEGRTTGLPFTFQAERHSILVDRTGCRFVSENDYNVGEALDRRDPRTGKPIHLPAWLIGDSRFLEQSPVFRWYALKSKGWVRRSPTLGALADEIGVPPDSLERTVERFNRFCDEGRDDDFGRGQSKWEDQASHGPRTRLTKVDEAPFVAVPVNRSILGTKGGARTDENGRVLRPDGSVVGGLYAAGLAMANPFGTRAIGPGTTLGPNMTWGFICAETALSQNTTANSSDPR